MLNFLTSHLQVHPSACNYISLDRVSSVPGQSLKALLFMRFGAMRSWHCSRNAVALGF